MTTTVPASRAHADARNDRMFRWLLVATVAFVLLALGSAAFSMLWGGRHALQAGGLDFFLDDVVGILQQGDAFFRDGSDDAHAQARAGERMPVHHLGRQAEHESELADLVLEQLAQRLEQA